MNYKYATIIDTDMQVHCCHGLYIAIAIISKKNYKYAVIMGKRCM